MILCVGRGEPETLSGMTRFPEHLFMTIRTIKKIDHVSERLGNDGVVSPVLSVSTIIMDVLAAASRKAAVEG
jgi:hypothetical protein